MERLRRGDGDAFGRLYDLTICRVAYVVQRTLLAPDHGAEVIQEVYLYAWQHAAVYDPARGSVVGWLTVIAYRRAVDRVRTTNSARLRDQHSAGTTEQVVPDIADLGIANLEAAQLRTALQQLTRHQHDAVRLTYLQGYTHREAAQMLAIPLGTLKTRVRAGVLALRAHLVPLTA